MRTVGMRDNIEPLHSQRLSPLFDRRAGNTAANSVTTVADCVECFAAAAPEATASPGRHLYRGRFSPTPSSHAPPMAGVDRPPLCVYMNEWQRSSEAVYHHRRGQRRHRVHWARPHPPSQRTRGAPVCGGRAQGNVPHGRAAIWGVALFWLPAQGLPHLHSESQGAGQSNQ